MDSDLGADYLDYANEPSIISNTLLLDFLLLTLPAHYYDNPYLYLCFLSFIW